MKVSLIVASGVHQGKAIPIAVPKFIIGRDPSCQLRPASQAVSKQHCGVVIRENKVFVVDFGSTNGTVINGEQLAPNSEREVTNGDRMQAGPLDFTIQFATVRPSDQTPLPAQLKPVMANGGSSAGDKLKAAAGVRATPAPVKPVAKPKSGSEDDMAAMLLSMDDDDSASGVAPSVPEGSTIMEMPVAMLDAAAGGKPEEKKTAVPTKESTSNAASEILKRYMRRPR
jgi:pSer/pThr/pTyr-binding forkhead associated (FHA) protein